MIFLSRPSVYNLPGTWEKQPDAMIPHLSLTPDQGFILFFGLVVIGLVAYGRDHEAELTLKEIEFIN